MAESKGDITISVGGSVSGGQIAAGSHITQSSVVGTAEPPSAAEVEELRRLLAELRQQIAEEAPEEVRQEAVGRFDELEEAIVTEQPDVSTMEYVKRWFARKLPTAAGLVASVLVHPVVGKIVTAAGDAVASEFRRRLGGEEG